MIRSRPALVFISLYYDDPEYAELKAALKRAVVAKQLIPERRYVDGTTPYALATCTRTGDAALEPVIEAAILKEPILSEVRKGPAEDIFKAHRARRNKAGTGADEIRYVDPPVQPN